jgi:hypothetical protein
MLAKEDSIFDDPICFINSSLPGNFPGCGKVIVAVEDVLNVKYLSYANTEYVFDNITDSG